MSLRDELLVAVRSCPQNDYDTRMLVEAIILPIIERALAAERAAVLEKAESCIARIPVDSLHGNEWVTAGRADVRNAAINVLRALSNDRSALEDATKMAAAQVRHEINQKIGQHLGQDANAKSLLQMLDDALAQARREQREKDVAAVKFFCDGHRRQALSAEEATAAILAQED